MIILSPEWKAVGYEPFRNIPVKRFLFKNAKLAGGFTVVATTVLPLLQQKNNKNDDKCNNKATDQQQNSNKKQAIHNKIATKIEAPITPFLSQKRPFPPIRLMKSNSWFSVKGSLYLNARN